MLSHSSYHHSNTACVKQGMTKVTNTISISTEFHSILKLNSQNFAAIKDGTCNI